MITPQSVDERVHRDDMTGLREKDAEHEPRLGAESGSHPIITGHLHGA
jgi:hypothetical protein